MKYKKEFTKNHLQMILSKNGGINSKQMAILDEIFNGRIKGWKNKLIGKWIYQEQLNALIKLKDSHLQLSRDENKKYIPRSEWMDKYLDPRWQKKKSEIMVRDGFVCKWCGANDKTLHVHHTKYHSEPWTTPNEYLVTICESCHLKHHQHEKREQKRNKIVKKWGKYLSD